MKQHVDAEIAALSSRYRSGESGVIEAFTRRFGEPIERIVRRALRAEGRDPSPLAAWIDERAAGQPPERDLDELAAAIAHEIGQAVLVDASRNGRAADQDTVTAAFATRRVDCRASVG